MRSNRCPKRDARATEWCLRPSAARAAGRHALNGQAVSLRRRLGRTRGQVTEQHARDRTAAARVVRTAAGEVVGRYDERMLSRTKATLMNAPGRDPWSLPPAACGPAARSAWRPTTQSSSPLTRNPALSGCCSQPRTARELQAYSPSKRPTTPPRTPPGSATPVLYRPDILQPGSSCPTGRGPASVTPAERARRHRTGAGRRRPRSATATYFTRPHRRMIAQRRGGHREARTAQISPFCTQPKRPSR
jgi:hypothetical protein